MCAYGGTTERDWRRVDADLFFMRRPTLDSGWKNQQLKASQDNFTEENKT